MESIFSIIYIWKYFGMPDSRSNLLSQKWHYWRDNKKYSGLPFVGPRKEERRRKPLSRRSFQFQYCSPRNQSRVRMPRRTENMLPLYCYCITLTSILQIRWGSRGRHRITSNLRLFHLEIPVSFHGEGSLTIYAWRSRTYPYKWPRSILWHHLLAHREIYDFTTFHVDKR